MEAVKTQIGLQSQRGGKKKKPLLFDEMSVTFDLQVKLGLHMVSKMNLARRVPPSSNCTETAQFWKLQTYTTSPLRFTFLFVQDELENHTSAVHYILRKPKSIVILLYRRKSS
jgi:hypothetical protein